MMTEKVQVPVGSRTEWVTQERLTEGRRGLRESHRKPSAQPEVARRACGSSHALQFRQFTRGSILLLSD